MLASGYATTTQNEIVEVKDFTVTMMLCYLTHDGDRQRLRVCAQKLSVRYRERFSKNLALEAFFADNPVEVINRCINMLNGSTAYRESLMAVVKAK